MNVLDVQCNNFDNDTASILVAPVTDTSNRLQTTESGVFKSSTVVLTSQPSADVTIPVSSSDTSEGIVNVSQLVFTNQNWNVPQTITVTGQDDLVSDGDVDYTVVLGNATSSDRNYNGKNPNDIYLTNMDDDTPGIDISYTNTNRYYLFEGGLTQHQYTYVLRSQPSSNVTISLSSSDTSEATVAVSSMVFTPENWNVPQTQTTYAEDDAQSDNDRDVDINGTASSSDGNYNGINVPSMPYRNIDDERTEVLLTPDTSWSNRMTTSENITSVTFQIMLTRAPTDDVYIDWTISDAKEGTMSTFEYTFTPENWAAPHTVTITGKDDVKADGTVDYQIDFNRASSNDNGYDRERPPSVFLENLDND